MQHTGNHGIQQSIHSESKSTSRGTSSCGVAVFSHTAAIVIPAEPPMRTRTHAHQLEEIGLRRREPSVIVWIAIHAGLGRACGGSPPSRHANKTAKITTLLALAPFCQMVRFHRNTTIMLLAALSALLAATATAVDPLAERGIDRSSIRISSAASPIWGPAKAAYVSKMLVLVPTALSAACER